MGMGTGGDHGAGGAFIPAIQGLRGWAALSVMLVHIQLMPILAGLWPVDGLPDWLTLSVATGGRGVELFFVISGYLIPASLRRHGSLPRFFAERGLRIVPVFALLHLVVYGVGPWIGYKLFAGLGPGDYAVSFAANLLFLAPLLDLPLAQQNAWSLTYEWLFYVWVAAAYLALERDPQDRPGTAPAGRRWLLVPLALVAAVVVWRFPSTSYFALGMAFSSRAPRLGLGPAGGLAVGLAALAAVYYVCEYVSVALGLVPAALVFALALDPGSGLSRLFARPVLQYLGRISYSLYLVHPFVLFGLLVAARRLGSGAPWTVPAALVFAGAAVGFSVAVAAVMYDLVEVRLRRRIEAVLRGPTPGPARAEGAAPESGRLDLPAAEAARPEGPAVAHSRIARA